MSGQQRLLRRILHSAIATERAASVLPATNFGTFEFQQQTLAPFTASGLGIGEIQTNNAATIVAFISD